MATYVMSDIHGQKELFDKMLKKIKFTETDELYILGDVIDRGPDPIALLVEVKNTPNIHLLLGNHEHMMKSYFGASSKWDTHETLAIWGGNGGRVTIAQFLALPKSSQEDILAFLNTIPVERRVTVNGQEFILCHAQPHPTSFKNDPFESPNIAYRYDTDDEFSVWHRHQVYYHEYDDAPYGIIPDENFSDKTIIFGHTPVFHYPNYNSQIPHILIEGNTINIDCGCSSIPYGNRNNGRLACLRLDDMEEFYEEP